jgi:hypothetical protein
MEHHLNTLGVHLGLDEGTCILKTRQVCCKMLTCRDVPGKSECRVKLSRDENSRRQESGKYCLAMFLNAF